MSKIKTYQFKNFLVYLTDATETAKEAIKAQQTQSLSSYILAKAINLFSPLNRIITKNGKVTTLIRSEGKIQSLVVDTNEDNSVKAYISNPNIIWDGNLNEALTMFGFRNGFLKIQLIDKYNKYESEIKMEQSTLVDDLSMFFYQSQQIKNAVLSCVKFDENENLIHSSSAIFTLLPQTSDHDVDWVEQFLIDNPYYVLGLEEFEKLLLDNGAQLMGENTFEWKCNCSKEKYESAIKLLSKEEIDKLIQEYGFIEAQCHYCHNKYKFFKDDFKEIN
ncbi:Hsp33 family molecular chaperone HslO [[Mycoplasma] gypis]|uniref:Hsp33 family molecular chaperone HslO n=1 Tax=[Mycoplasma] gypis TaxID=92404 RepID=A0ABZ2RQ49_9BACT|nr:Hsp33 family molecular chaperone HslO [[Mycoplasma] gypis]MBN0919071.1 Hsp33 family molecular chaperone HslO [[Mycoplasma] gypis]